MTASPLLKTHGRNQMLLSGFLISNLDALRWKAAIYEVKPQSPVSIPTRATVKEITWSFKKANKNLCPGYGFIVERDESTVAVPAHWTIADGATADGYEFRRIEEQEVHGADPRHGTLFSRIIKDALRSHLKKVGPGLLGPLWQDYGTLCQIPTQQTENDFAFYRKFDFDPKALSNGRWALRFVASTGSIDAHSVQHYYSEGRVAELASMIQVKLNQRTNRRGRPVNVRVFHGTKRNGERSARVLDLFSPEQILDDAKLAAGEQTQRNSLPLQCRDFVDGVIAVPRVECHLILDSQITHDDHEMSIMEPGERAKWASQLRDLSQWVRNLRSEDDSF